MSKRFEQLKCKGHHPTSVIGDGTCDECRPLYEERYPQGWQSYPGDTCPYGVYTGGCGIDRMCAACEEPTVEQALSLLGECPTGCNIPEHEHYAEPGDGCIVEVPHA